ncbi:MAG: phosphoribosylamine--glycine ligase [Rhodobiaceae bacterium]|jgi:phosphoribosylamine--glycine ligase|nr:phosphoribosylamine--glycine ligase [Rhodobiaceae bacterium]MBT5518755.1 phosphoribosylamine--glycine ligase [Rhodobiaceae bacterium]MBT7280167.1 phosphoribosylamine--glycine ligase [Rhodobiaceae bacterium]MDG2495491.1 phosphoribosylamine--glycine ligase [Alphaproteobacteria bacterium]
MTDIDTSTKRNILVLGSGGREHALCWKIAQSPLLNTLYCAPGNGGTASVAHNVALEMSDHAAVIQFCQEKNIHLVVIGPEAPLVAGLGDDLHAANIAAFGPSREAAQLEGSKGYTKDLCAEADIPTAAYGRFDNAAEALAYLETQSAPIVVKADGLAAGKGVIIAETMQQARDGVADIFDGAFGAAGAELVIEEFMTGEEASFFVLCDGENALPLATAQDHKRVGDGDTGPNTGGMGAYSPASIMTQELIDISMQQVIYPTLQAMAKRGTPYRGVLYAGLMLTPDGPKLVEYNARFGDPECQVLMMRLASDIVPALEACASPDGSASLAGLSLDWHPDMAMTVVMAANGYPGSYEKGSVIEGLDKVSAATVFHAGTTRAEDGSLRAIGGRVLNVTALGKTVAQAQANAYAGVDRIEWPQGFCRRDIGHKEIAREG